MEPRWTIGQDYIWDRHQTVVVNVGLGDAEELVAAANATERMRELLRMHEWCSGTGEGWCMHCHRYHDDGHTPDCPMAMLLKGDNKPGGEPG